MSLRATIVSCTALALLVGCATGDGTATTGTAEDEAAIRQLADDWAAHYNARDAAAIAGMMAADYHEVTPMGEHLTSPADVQAMMERDFAQAPAGISVGLTTAHVTFLDGDDAFAGGTYTSAGVPEGMPTRGSWLVIFSKDSTGWKMRSGLGSADLSYMMPTAPADTSSM